MAHFFLKKLINPASMCATHYFFTVQTDPKLINKNCFPGFCDHLWASGARWITIGPRLEREDVDQAAAEFQRQDV